MEQTAAALEEITTAVGDSSYQAQEAGQLVRRTKESAERSGIVVRDAVEAMGKIETSASEIGNIIGVIDEIAFQTDVLPEFGPAGAGIFRGFGSVRRGCR